MRMAHLAPAPPATLASVVQTVLPALQAMVDHLLQYATSAKRELILQYLEPLLPQRVKVRMFIFGEPKLVWVGLFWGGRGWIVGVRGVWAGCARIRFVRVCSACQHKKTHTYVKPQMIHKQTPKPQHVKPASTLGRQRQHASKNVLQEPTLSPQPHHATSAKQEPFLE